VANINSFVLVYFAQRFAAQVLFGFTNGIPVAVGCFKLAPTPVLFARRVLLVYYFPYAYFLERMCALLFNL
jgi:hypothetical protein